MPKEDRGLTLREYVDQRLADIGVRLDDRWAGHIHWSESQYSNLAHRLDQLETRLNNVTARLNEMEGSRVGLRTGWTVLVAAIASASALFLIIDFFSGR
jgi:tetrahydromethanopterin S-methyltransferase subunit G